MVNLVRVRGRMEIYSTHALTVQVAQYNVNSIHVIITHAVLRSYTKTEGHGDTSQMKGITWGL